MFRQSKILSVFTASISCCEGGEGGEGGEGLKWFNMHVIVFVTSRAFK